MSYCLAPMRQVAAIAIFYCASLTVVAQTRPTLPQSQVDTAFSHAPVTGRSIAVAAGQDLQAAIYNANPGDEIVLQAGGTWTGAYVLPDKGLQTSWITIRSSAMASLPAPGTRVSPGNAGNMPKIVADGPRAAFFFQARANHYRLIGLEITEQPKQWVNYGLILQGDPSDPNPADLPSYITFDRCYIHGQALGHIKFGWQMNGSYLAIIDSYVTEMHGIGQDTQALTGYMGTGPFKISNNFLEGAGENVQFGGAYDAIPNTTTADVTFTGNYLYKPGVWRTNTIVPPPSSLTGYASSGGSLPAGTYYYSAIAAGTAGTLDQLPGQAQSSRSNEIAVNVGGGQNAVALQWGEQSYGDSLDTRLADNYVVLRSQDPPGASSRNWVYYGVTPATGSTTINFTDTGSGARSGFNEIPRYWTVKNLFEIKNGARWLVDGNVFEDNWAAAQNGFSILLTPRNETPFMPGNKVADFTFQNNVMRHVAGGINIGSEDDTQPASYASQQIPTARIAFLNNLFEDINSTYNGNGIFFQAAAGVFPGQPALQDLILDHNTVFQTANIGDIDCCGSKFETFTITNNIFGEASGYGWFVNGQGQSHTALTQAINNLTFTNNVWAGNPSAYQFAGNYYPTDLTQVGFVNYNGGDGGDYHLTTGGAYTKLALDGNDPGANIDTINTVIAAATSGQSNAPGNGGSGPSPGGPGNPTPVVSVPPPTALVQIVNKNSGKCLTTLSNYKVAQYACSASNPAQTFNFIPSLDSSGALLGYQILSHGDGSSLDVWGMSKADAAVIGVYSFRDAPNELFNVTPDNNGGFFLIAKHSSSCLDISAFSVADGTTLQQWNCNGGSNQSFTLMVVAQQADGCRSTVGVISSHSLIACPSIS